LIKVRIQAFFGFLTPEKHKFSILQGFLKYGTD
jgi:hypothetical protein